MDKNRLIGSNGRLPWHIPEDLAWFKHCTMGHIVIMGRKTWLSLGKPLAGRDNVVLSSDIDFVADGALVLGSVEEVLSYCNRDSNVAFQCYHVGTAFVIGGASVFQQFLPEADYLYLTRIEAEFSGDTYFPDFLPSHWKELEHHEIISATGIPLSFHIYCRTSRLESCKGDIS